MRKSGSIGILGIAVVLAVRPAPLPAQDSHDFVRPFEDAPWTQLGETAPGVKLSISQRWGIAGGIATFALRNDIAEGDTASIVTVYKLNCAAKTVSKEAVSNISREGERISTPLFSHYEAFEPGSVMGQIAAKLCRS